jgi:hypothetical protein
LIIEIWLLGFVFNIPSLTMQDRFANICHVPEWWNWQTRRTQNPVSLADMGVQAPPSAPKKSKGCQPI